MSEALVTNRGRLMRLNNAVISSRVTKERTMCFMRSMYIVSNGGYNSGYTLNSQTSRIGEGREIESCIDSIGCASRSMRMA